MVHFLTRYAFIGGIFLGVAVTIVLLYITTKPAQSLDNYLSGPFANRYDTWLSSNNLKRFAVSMDFLRYANHSYLLESQFLYNNVHIACIVLAHNVNNTKAAELTWAKHCNSYSALNMTFTKSLNNRRHNHAWLALCNRLQQLPSIFDWLLVVTDDTFAILENIRYFVAGLDSKTVYYLGHALTFWGVTYNSGQAGYLLSNATVTMLKNQYVCHSDFSLLNLEDYYLGKALFSLNVTPSDTRDDMGMSTFHGFNLPKLFFPGSTLLSNYYKFSVYPIKCCSYKSVTFKVSASDQMFTYEYLLHHLQIFNYGHYGNRIPTTPNPEKEVWLSFLKEHGITNGNIDSTAYYQLWEKVMKQTLQGHVIPH